MPYTDLALGFKYKSKEERNTEIQIIKESHHLELSEDRYYVYAYLHPKFPGEYIYGNFKFDYAPFYIGKGVNSNISSYQRLFSHLYYNPKKMKSDKHKTIDKIKKEMNRLPIIIKVIENVSEEISFDVENFLIEKIGRIENRTGMLTNIQRGHKTKWEKEYEKIKIKK